MLNLIQRNRKASSVSYDVAMKTHLAGAMLLAILATTPLPSQAQQAPSRGQLLYDAHCIECHTQQMHWRTLKRARDWDTLTLQVRRWQGEAKLAWSDSDVQDVARYLNETIYHFPRAVSLQTP